MTRTFFMAGISAIALAAGAASAQTNGDNTDPNTGNRVVISCTTASNNNCTVTQAAGTTFSSTGSVNATGTNNTSTVNQTGNRQYAENRATGDRNSAQVTQRAFNNSASITQTGTASANLGAANFGVVTQGTTGGLGNNNTAQIVQVRTAGAGDSASFNNAQIQQGTTNGGFNNQAVLTQNGTALTSFISQNDFTNGGLATSNNSATVSQTNSAGAFSSITQNRSGNVASVSMFGGNNTTNTAPTPVTGRNVSSVFQGNTQFQAGATSGTFTANAPTTASSPNTGNSVTVAITGLQNNSNVFQDGVQNTVDQSILNGGVGNTSAANATGTNPGTGAAFPANRPEGNSSTINQSGRGNYAATSIGGRVTAGGGAGNISTITQNQGDAAVGATTLTSTQGPTTAHRALVYQRGILDQVGITQNNNNAGGSSTGAGTAVQSGSLADVATLSFNSSTTVNQTGTNTARVTQGARTETNGANDVTTITQVDAGDITTTTTTPGQGGGFGGSGGSSTTTATGVRNFAEVVQYGTENTSTVNQNAINASATVFQAVSTRGNQLNVQQGTQAVVANQVAGLSANQSTSQNDAANNTFNTQNVTATVNQNGGSQAGQGNTTVNNGNGVVQALGVTIAQSGRNLTATANQTGGTNSPAGAAIVAANNSNNSILIAQANAFNSASVTQAGSGLVATVEQRGTGSATLQNLVTISQSGGGTTAATANVALARQTVNVGASAANGATAGVPNDQNFPNSRTGANSAEIVISQSGTGGSATVEQRGKGQYASLTQTGTTNVGGILQDAAATNAVAVLSQSGANNTYFINQTTPGQYIQVTQNGTSNSVINGPSGVGNSTPSNTPPTFGGVQ